MVERKTGSIIPRASTPGASAALLFFASSSLVSCCGLFTTLISHWPCLSIAPAVSQFTASVTKQNETHPTNQETLRQINASLKNIRIPPKHGKKKSTEYRTKE